jgi:hypothetical protein
MRENLRKFFQQESLSRRSERMVPAAAYGALVATIYTLTLSFINVYTFPKLPLGMDWTRMLGMWIGLGVAFAVCGVIAGWFTEEYEGIVGGGVIITVLLIIILLISSAIKTSTSTAQSIITTLPLIGVAMLAAWGLRWIVRRHSEIVHKEKPELRKKLLTRHILMVVLIGFIPGVLGRMDSPSENTISQLHELLQAAPSDPLVLPRLPLKQVPALKDHFGVDYLLYIRQSKLSIGTLDVTVRFKDGFTMTCSLPVSSGMSFITQCNEGDEVETK